MLCDSEGYVWLFSNCGVWKFNYDQMLVVVDGMSIQFEFEYFDEGDGMVISQVNGGINFVFVSLLNGELFFVIVKGVVSIKVQCFQ